MTKQEEYAFDLLREVMVEHAFLEPEAIHMDATLRDLLLDELDYGFVSAALEDDYEISLPMDCEFTTVREIVEYINERYELERTEEE